MLKRFSVALAALFVLSTSAFGAGTVPGFSLTPQFDKLGAIAPGCKLYVIQSGTVATPQNAYQDSGLTLLQSNPILCDAAGRLPQFFVADGTIKLRLTTRNSTEIFVQDNLLVIGASSGGGGGSPVDATTVLATGDLKPRYATGVLAGFVRANGRTIGNASSGATERANSDTAALFTHLYLQDANLAVSGGRGASAAADYAANKTIALPDWRGRALAFLDDMGNAAAGRLTVSFFGSNATVLGASGGLENHTLTLAQSPVHDHGGLTGVATANHTHTQQGTFTSGAMSTNAAHTHTVPEQGFAQTGSAVPAALSQGSNNGGLGTITSSSANVDHTHTVTLNGQTSTESATHLHSITSAGGGAAHNNTQPTMLATIYIKL